MRILIFPSYSPYDLVSFSWILKIRVYLPKARPWCFSALSVPLFNFGDSPVPHIQRQDGNLMVDGFSWHTSGKSLARNFCAIINTLSNRFLFTFNRCVILELVHWTCLSFTLSLSLASTNTKTLSEDHFSNLVHVFKNWKLLFENFCGNTCGWKSVLKYVKCCLKTKNDCSKIQTKHPLSCAELCVVVVKI